MVEKGFEMVHIELLTEKWHHSAKGLTQVTTDHGLTCCMGLVMWRLPAELEGNCDIFSPPKKMDENGWIVPLILISFVINYIYEEIISDWITSRDNNL